MTLAVAAKALAWIAVAAIAALRPTFGAAFFRGVERMGGRLARRRALACVAIGVFVLVVRAALVPVWPVPKPTIFDEFSYILGADTFAHGRLANPEHPLAPFFESAYVLMRPTYASKYPPGQALFMAAGQVLFGDPWFGVWLSCGAMAAALLWALQCWLPPGWALFGGIVALPLAIDSYWMNSYWGGAVAAIGGALVLGGYARIVKHGRVWHALTVGVGLAILANTRPYEGLLYSIPVAIGLLASRPRWIVPGLLACVLIPAAAATAYYDRAVTGDAWRMPYTEYLRQYAKVPSFNVLAAREREVHGTEALDDLLNRWEPQHWNRARSWGLIPDRLNDWRSAAATILGGAIAVLPLLVFFPKLCRDRRIRLPLAAIGAVLAGSWIEICYYQHYFAPAAAALLIVAVQAFRHLRAWPPGGKRFGMFLARALPTVVLGAVLVQRLYLFTQPLHAPANAVRGEVANLIGNLIDRHVILVRYTVQRTPHEEFVYNGAAIDDQEVIWAHDLGAERNQRLLDYYKDRKIWLYQPDIDPLRLEPYSPSAARR